MFIYTSRQYYVVILVHILTTEQGRAAGADARMLGAEYPMCHVPMCHVPMCPCAPGLVGLRSTAVLPRTRFLKPRFRGQIN